MIGDAYFQLRDSLSESIGLLRDQAEMLGTGVEELMVLDNVRASLTEPFVFVVVGEVNVGKSSFLNALFGREFSPSGIVPTTDKILFFKHGETQATVPVTPTLDEVHIPCEFLRDFHIVDTPGTNSIQDEHQQITERFIPAADLVIFVFSATNPWGASAWQFLERVHREWLRNVIFVLQQCDLRTHDEVQVITDYMRQLCRQRFGCEFPIFPVSAKTVIEARGHPTDAARTTGGFAPLEKHISASVTGTDARHAKLIGALNLVKKSLGRVKERLLESHEAAQRRSTQVQELATERELQIERTLQKIRPAINATERDYHESAIRVANLAAETLSTRRAFHGPPPDAEGDDEADDEEEDRNRQQPSLDHRLYLDLQHHNSDRWRQVALILDEDVRQFERFLLVRGASSLPAGVPALEPASNEARQDLRRHFTGRVGGAIRRFVIGLHLDETIEPGLRKAARRARMVPRLTAPVIIGAFACFYFDGWRSAAAVTVSGLLCLLAFYILTKVVLNATKRQLIEKLEGSANRLHELLTEHVNQDVEAAFAPFEGLLNTAVEITRAREKNLEDRIASLAELEARFHELNGRLRAAAAGA